MDFQTAAFEWQAKLLQRLLAEKISPKEILGIDIEPPHTAPLEDQLRKVEQEAERGRAELREYLEKQGLDPAKILDAKPPESPVPSSPPPPLEVQVESLAAQAVSATQELRDYLAKQGVDPEKMLQPPLPEPAPPVPKPLDEMLRSLQEETARAQAQLAEQFRTYGIDIALLPASPESDPSG